MDLFIEVGQVVFASPLAHLLLVTVGMSVVVVAAAIPFVQPALVLALELVVQHHALDRRAAVVQALRFALVGAIDLEVVFQFPLASQAVVERLAVIPAAATMALEESASLL